MGLGVAAVFNPQFGEVLSPLSTFYSLLTMALFFITDLHHMMLEGVVRSFEITSLNYQGVFDAVMKLNSFFFPLAFKIAAPIFLVQILVQVAIGFLSRAMPQANIFFVSFPLLIGVGFIFMAITTSLVFLVVTRSFIHMKDAIMVLVR
jgi:flagellar biosynthetic protein FliR